MRGGEHSLGGFFSGQCQLTPGRFPQRGFHDRYLFPRRVRGPDDEMKRKKALSDYGCFEVPHESISGLLSLCDAAAPSDVCDTSDVVFKISGGGNESRRHVVCDPSDLSQLRQEIRKVLRTDAVQAQYGADSYYVSEAWEVACRLGGPGDAHVDAFYSERGVGGTIAFNGNGWHMGTEFFRGSNDKAPKIANSKAFVFDGSSLHRSPRCHSVKWARKRYFLSFIRSNANECDLKEWRDAMEKSYFRGFGHLRLHVSVRDAPAEPLAPTKSVSNTGCPRSSSAGVGSTPSIGPNPNPKLVSICKDACGRGRKDGGGRARGIIANPIWAEGELDLMIVGRRHHAEPHPGMDAYHPARFGRLLAGRLPLSKRHTDDESCALDALEEACRAGFNRENLGVPSGPVKLMSEKVKGRIQKAGYALKQLRAVIAKRRKHQRAATLSLQRIMGQRYGVFLVELQWRVSELESDWHVVVVNCDGRYVFDNTFGYLPFNMGKTNESSKTHDELAGLFHIRCVPQAWKVHGR